KEIVQEVGLPTDHLEDVLHSSVYDAEVSADIELAQQYGLDAVPALVFNNKYLVSGAQPYDVLRKVVEKVQAEEAEA
ncbi:MAG TPA: DsbA family protein, partial [Ktedonobacteraceae bacterium]|nr:DsbA family protein [Ktedonobacteraceae bacterium]